MSDVRTPCPSDFLRCNYYCLAELMEWYSSNNVCVCVWFFFRGWVIAIIPLGVDVYYILIHGHAMLRDMIIFGSTRFSMLY